MFSLIDERQLKHSLALWTIKNGRFAPQPGSCGEAAFIENYVIPDTEFELTTTMAGSDDTIISIFRTIIRLAPWQSRSGKECKLIYCKAVISELDSIGNIFSQTKGYSIISE